tara:strand:- start:17 stop:556 length:540 start_codon:yes stop_codon:yes gene_type:complete
MDSSDIINAIIIILIFAIINIASILGMGIEHIKQNWNEYKCMPVIIPFAGLFGHQSTETFNECVQGITGNFISDILGPVYTIFNQISSITDQIGSFMTTFNTMTGGYKNNFLSNITDVYGIGTRILLGLTQFGIKIQDMFNRVLGIFVTIIFIIIGLNTTVISIWNGLPGQIVRVATSM